MGGKSKDLTNKIIGKWKVIERSGKIGSCIAWLCECECGERRRIRSAELNRETTKSCGCLQKEIVKQFTPPGCVDGTYASGLTSKISKANKTGSKGVWEDKKNKRFQAYITFKRKRYHLGHYKNIEQAIKVRKQAEEMLFEPFLEWYEEFKKSQKSAST